MRSWPSPVSEAKMFNLRHVGCHLSSRKQFLIIEPINLYKTKIELSCYRHCLCIAIVSWVMYIMTIPGHFGSVNWPEFRTSFQISLAWKKHTSFDFYWREDNSGFSITTASCLVGKLLAKEIEHSITWVVYSPQLWLSPMQTWPEHVSQHRYVFSTDLIDSKVWCIYNRLFVEAWHFVMLFICDK